MSSLSSLSGDMSAPCIVRTLESTCLCPQRILRTAFWSYALRFAPVKPDKHLDRSYYATRPQYNSVLHPSGTAKHPRTLTLWHLVLCCIWGFVFRRLGVSLTKVFISFYVALFSVVFCGGCIGYRRMALAASWCLDGCAWLCLRDTSLIWSSPL